MKDDVSQAIDHASPFWIADFGGRCEASIGFTIGASTTKLVGRALNLRSPGDIAGSYAVVGAGGALAAGAGGVQLRNANGVLLQLSGPKVGVELSAAMGGVTIAMR